MATIVKDRQDSPARHERNCCCPVCRGLGTYDRPVFGAGQILTAADLTGLQDYVRAKNRLHTRYLHGWGVVCGLEVVCDDCEGSVTIRPGYAVDPCGADIVVAGDTRFDLIAAIRDCAARARAKTGDCDPWMPPPDPGCGDAESHWCVALKYREVETAYVPGFPTARACGPAAPASGGGGGCGDGCGCGGGCGGGCGCQGGSAGPAPSLAAAPRTSNTSCAPRRIMECFDITAIESKDGCAPILFKQDRDPTTGQTSSSSGQLGAWDQLIPQGSLLRNILDCVLGDIQMLTDRLGSVDSDVLGRLWTDSPAQLIAAGVTTAQAHASVCKFKSVVMDMLAADTHPVRCQMRRAASEIVLPAPTALDPPDSYFVTAKEALNDLMAVWLQLILDCICHAFLPQCDGDPCDDRVEIACVTVKAGKILRICNHSCRRYAGAFPSTFYWMSLIPVLPLIARALAALCCQPDLVRRNSPLVNDLAPLLDRVDPAGGLRRAVGGNGFALPRQFLAQAAATGASPLLSALARRFDVAGGAVTHAGQPPVQAKGELESAGVEVSIQEMDAGDEKTLKDAMMRRPLLRRGDRAVVYTKGDKVVAVVREDDSELARLRRDVDELRKAIDARGTAPRQTRR